MPAVKKSYPGKILVSRSFPTQAEAVSFAKEYKSEYKQTDLSIKYDINRTPAGEWTSTIYVKV
jgi:hypothetical protein